jgi:ribonuclease HI/exonuclease III
MMEDPNTGNQVPPGETPPTPTQPETTISPPTPLPASSEHLPSPPNANGSSTTAAAPRGRRARTGPQNPYAAVFQFHLPSDFAPTRRATGGFRCGTINTQSISRPALREAVYSTLEAWDLGILALQETWLRENEATALATSVFHASGGARTFSTVAPETDNRHLGVTLILGEEIARHHQHTDTFGGTAIRLKLRWQRREIHVIAVYVPPPDGPNQELAEATCSMVTGWLCTAEAASIDVILLGDLNDCANPAVDRVPPESTASRPKTQLMLYLTQSEYYSDLWRRRHGSAAAYTFPHRQPADNMSRLDYIWTSPALTQLVIGVGTAESKTDLAEGHRMVCAELATQALFPITRTGSSRQTGQRSERVDLRAMTEERWRDFQAATDRDLPDALKEMLDAATGDCLPEDRAGRQACFQLIRELEEFLLRCAKDLPQILPGVRRKQAIRDADLSCVRLRISSIKKWWRRGGRRALARLLATRQSVLDRAELPGPLRECLERLAAPPADVPPELQAAKTILNATMKHLGRARARAAAKRLQSKIHSAIIRRCDQFRSNMGAMLRSLKRGALTPNTRVDRALFTDADGTLVLETEAEAVQTRVRAHFEAWFGPRNGGLETAPESIRSEYQPHPDIEAAWFDGLMSPITLDELYSVLRTLPRGKAPGKSGLINELWVYAGLKCKRALLLLLNECLRLEDIPEDWKKGVVVPIPKTAEFTGNLDQLRPITLLESTRKVFSAVLTRRLQQVIERRKVLNGFNLGFRANRQAADLAFAIQGLCEASRTAGRPIDLLSLDVRRAYDSVSLTTLQHSLRRIRVPEGYIRLLSTIHSTRTAQIRTAHGLTQPYSPATGLDQGEINAPILWLIVYDPLLCLLEKSGKGVLLGGLVKDTPAMRKIHPDLRDELDKKVIFGGAYADDLTLTAASRADLQKLADICSDWCEAHDIEINPAKSVHLSYNPVTSQPTLGAPIQLGRGTRRAPVLKLQPLGEPLRVLGMYIVPNGKHAPMLEMCKELAARQANLLRSRATTDKIALFVIRAVLMPALTYKMQGHAFNRDQVHEIFMPLMHALKHACGLPISFPSSLMHHRLGGKVPRLETVHMANNLTLLMRAMNAPSPLCEIILARIAATEHALLFPGPILQAPWHAQQVQRMAAKGGRRLLIPALATVLGERGVVIGKPAFSPQWQATNALPKPPQWLLDVYRDGLTCLELKTAYCRGCVLVSDVFLRDASRRVALQPQPQGGPTNLIAKMKKWIRDGPDEEGSTRLQVALNPGLARPHRLAHEPTAPFYTPFTQAELERVYGQHCASTDPGTKWVVYTDGSVIQRDGQARGAFAGTFTQGPDTPIDFRGRVLELPLSSTRMEAMAIAAAVAITPPSTPLEILTDSLAAAHMMNHVAAPAPSRELNNSPDAFLWLHLRVWMQARSAPVTVVWIKGHSGVAGNEKADQLATSAHDLPAVTRWTTQMPPPGDAPFWIMHDGRVIPRRPRRLLREQDEAITSDRLVEQVNSVPGRPRQSPSEVKHILRVLRWTTLPTGETQKKKGWNITSPRDSYIRSFGYKQLMGFLPTLARQRAWYPDVYNRQELYQCAKCRQPEETQDHLYECADHAATEECFGERHRTIQQGEHTWIDPAPLSPWRSLGLLQGRVDPGWETAIPQLRRGTRRTAAVIKVVTLDIKCSVMIINR